MMHARLSCCLAIVAAAMASLFALDCCAQDTEDTPQDHSCTVNVAGGPVIPSGKDGNNFNTGWNIQAGGGFAVVRSKRPERGTDVFITTNFMYDKLPATSEALKQAKSANMMELANATSAHGSFSAVTLDPTVRRHLNLRTSLYLSGGFGWFHRGVSFNGANPATLLQPNGITLDRLAADSGVFDLGGGVNFGLTRRGGPMLYFEARVYRGAAVNSGTTLVPLSVGVRW
jgi:hypothetical protein